MVNRIDHQQRPSIMLWVMKFIFMLIRFFVGSKSNYDIVKERMRFDKMAQRIPKLKGFEINKFMIGEMRAEWIKPKNAKRDKVLYYLHGGAYAVCSMETHRRMVGKIAEAAGIIALGIEYRMIPEAAFPAATKDALMGYKYLLSQGYKGSDIVVAGDSAGGGLSAALVQILRKEGLPQPALSVLLSPWADLAGTGESNTKFDVRTSIINQHGLLHFGAMYAANTDINNPLVSPIYGDFTNTTPMYIVVSRHELIYNDSTRLATQVDSYGVPVTLETYPKVMHVWQVFDYLLPEARQSIKQLGNVIKAAL